MGTTLTRTRLTPTLTYPWPGTMGANLFRYKGVLSVAGVPQIDRWCVCTRTCTCALDD